MLDLDVIFDPQRVEQVVVARRCSAAAPVEDLEGWAETSIRAHADPELYDDLWFEFQERAAVMEFCGGLPREQAEAMALQETLDRMAAAIKKEEST